MTTALKALLAERIDYAGLFAPASLPMEEAVANFAAYRSGADAWALGRLIVPVVLLDEFEAAAAPHFGGTPWRVSVLAQATDADIIRAFNARHAGHCRIDTVESRVATIADVDALAPLAPMTVYVEIAVHNDPAPLVQAVAGHGLRAKVRTGGVTAEAIPSSADLARFLATCARHRVALKATAGLHHPLRGEYLLTYDPASARATMFGFVNVLLATSLAWRGLPESELAALLDERSSDAFRVSAGGVGWRAHTLTTSQLAVDGRRGAVSFGSCSFREPLDDLSALFLP